MVRMRRRSGGVQSSGSARVAAHAPMSRAALRNCVSDGLEVSRIVSVGPLRCLATMSSACVLLLGVGVVAVDEHDDVGVLLDGARLAKVGELRSLVGARLRVAVELGERDHRDVQLLGQELEDRLISATSCWRLSGGARWGWSSAGGSRR